MIQVRHNTSSSQSIGKPIAETFMSGYFSRRALKRLPIAFYSEKTDVFKSMAGFIFLLKNKTISFQKQKLL